MVKNGSETITCHPTPRTALMSFASSHASSNFPVSLSFIGSPSDQPKNIHSQAFSLPACGCCWQFEAASLTIVSVFLLPQQKPGGASFLVLEQLGIGKSSLSSHPPSRRRSSFERCELASSSATCTAGMSTVDASSCGNRIPRLRPCKFDQHAVFPRARYQVLDEFGHRPRLRAVSERIQGEADPDTSVKR